MVGPAAITQEELKRLVSYNPRTGVFVWLKNIRKSCELGSSAGRMMGGMMKMNIAGKQRLLSRLAFIYMEGYDSINQIKYKDGDKTNISWANLYEYKAKGKKVKKAPREEQPSTNSLWWLESNPTREHATYDPSY